MARITAVAFDISGTVFSLAPRRERSRSAGPPGHAPGHPASVAAHPRDVHGAESAGPVAGRVCRGASRPPVMAAPDVEGTESAGVARDPARPRG